MPNWCTNYMDVSHPDPTKMRELLTAYGEGQLLQYAKPMPEALNIERSFGPDNPDLEAIRAANKRDYGYEDWYDWRYDNWGTKWDVLPNTDSIEIEGESVVMLQFETAWCPPIKAFEALKEQGFHIEVEYTEEGGFFIGTWKDGEDFSCRPEEAPPELSHLVAVYDDIDEEVE